MFMAAMEMTVVSTAMPTVVGDLGGLHLYSWVFTAYMLASTVTVPLYGKLVDVYGRKPIMLFGLALFVAGSAASGFATSIEMLIAFRVLQGLGAGAVQPTAFTIVGDLFNVEQRGKMMGLFGAVWGLAGICGPLLGGLIVDALSWHWIFFVNLPFGIASAVVLILSFHETIERRAHPLDLTGALVITAGVLVLLAGAHGGSTALVAVPVAAGLFYAFVIVERRAADPVLPMDLFHDKVISVSSIASALVGASMISTVTYVPLYVQGVLGGTPTEAGGAIAPMVIGWPIAAAVAGRLLPRVGPQKLIRIGLFVSAVAALLLALFLRPGVTLWVPRLATAFFGVGMGLANTALLIAVQTSVPWKRRGVATASTMFFRTVGGTLAVGALGGVLAAALRRDPSIPLEAADQLLGSERGKNLAPSVLEALAGALQGSIATILWIIAAIAAVGFVVSLRFPHMSFAKSEPVAEPMAQALPEEG